MTTLFPPLSPPRAILFDWDLTLVDNFGAVHAALMDTLDAYGIARWSFDETVRRAKRSLRDSFPELFGDDWEQARTLFHARFESRHLQTLTPLPGAAALLETLNSQGVPAGIVSNKTGKFLRREVEHLGWERFFRKVVGATDTPRDKPAPDPALAALEGSGLMPGRDVIWFVGDTVVDVQCALASGCLPIVIGGNRTTCEGEFDDFPPACYVNDCIHLSELVGRALRPE